MVDDPARHAAVEPVAGQTGEVGWSAGRINRDKDSNAVRAGLTEEVVEVVEIWHGSGGAGRGKFGGGNDERVDVEGSQSVEADGESLRVDGLARDVIEDCVLPPLVGVDRWTLPARSGQELCGGGAGCCQQQAGWEPAAQR